MYSYSSKGTPIESIEKAAISVNLSDYHTWRESSLTNCSDFWFYTAKSLTVGFFFGYDRVAGDYLSRSAAMKGELFNVCLLQMDIWIGEPELNYQKSKTDDPKSIKARER